MIIELPMGIKQSDNIWAKIVELDEITGKDEDILADMSRAPGGKGVLANSASRKMTRVLSRCTVRIGEETRPSGKSRDNMPGYFEPHWTTAFMNDRAFSFIRLRQLSLGDKYSFSEICPECEKEIPNLSLDLSALEVTTVPLETVSAGGGLFTLVTSRGSTIVWKALRGEDEDGFLTLKDRYKDKLLSALMLTKVISINGNKPKIEDLENLKGIERAELRADFDTKEGGVDVEIVNTCDNPECRHVFRKYLNPGRVDFFFPSGTK